MAKKKQSSNAIGWVILGLLAVAIFHFGQVGQRDEGRRASPGPSPAQSSSAATPSAPLSQPRFVNVASLNVRHSPGASGEMIMALPRGTSLRVLERRDGWLLIDINPTLEGWVAEHLTTTQVPQQRPIPPASLAGSH